MMVYQVVDGDGVMKPMYGNGTRYYVSVEQAYKVKERANNALKRAEYKVVQYQLVPTGEVF